MIRAILIFIVIATLAASSAWLADNPGHVTLTWGDWRIDTSAAVLSGLVVALVAVMSGVYRFWLFLRRTPGQLGQSWRAGRTKKGQKALAHGMVAVAAGDAKEAAKLAAKAEGLLGGGELTLLLKAQAAQMVGDDQAAATFFTAMLDDEDTAFLGLRGLINQAMAAGDAETAIALAERAKVLRPKSAWLAETLFALNARIGAWGAAQSALTDESKSKSITKGEIHRRKSTLLHQQSLDADTPAQALKFAKAAYSESEAFLPGIIRYAALSQKAGHTRKVIAVVEQAWKHSPHADLLAPYFAAHKAVDAMAQFKAVQGLVKLNAIAAESRLALASLALDAQLWGEARAALLALVDGGADSGEATTQAYQLLARLEQQQHDDGAAANGWLMRAAQADPDPAWVCDSCGHVESSWTIRCAKCDGFDTYGWGTPAHAVLLRAPEGA